MSSIVSASDTLSNPTIYTLRVPRHPQIQYLAYLCRAGQFSEALSTSEALLRQDQPHEVHLDIQNIIKEIRSHLNAQAEASVPLLAQEIFIEEIQTAHMLRCDGELEPALEIYSSLLEKNLSTEQREHVETIIKETHALHQDLLLFCEMLKKNRFKEVAFLCSKQPAHLVDCITPLRGIRNFAESAPSRLNYARSLLAARTPQNFNQARAIALEVLKHAPQNHDALLLLELSKGTLNDAQEKLAEIVQAVESGLFSQAIDKGRCLYQESSDKTMKKLALAEAKKAWESQRVLDRLNQLLKEQNLSLFFEESAKHLRDAPPFLSKPISALLTAAHSFLRKK